jgi:hypothetical protein
VGHDSGRKIIVLREHRFGASCRDRRQTGGLDTVQIKVRFNRITSRG